MSILGRLVNPRAASWGGMTLLGSLALFLYAAHQSGRSELRALCEQGERGVEPRIYRRVSAEGYFDGGISCLRNGCWGVLTNSGYRYIEVEKRDADPWDPIPADGFYRLSKVPLDSGNCDAKILEEMRRSFSYRGFVAGGMCLAVEKIEAPRAAYGIFSEQLDPVDAGSLFPARIGARHFFVKEMAGGRLVAEQTSYILFQKNALSFSSFQNIIHCYSPGIGARRLQPDINDLESVITPM